MEDGLEEVRSLALRSKEAAMRTEGLIRQSVSQAEEGERASKDFSVMLGQIVSVISKVCDIVSEISDSAKDQSLGIEQINRAVGDINQVTQENAASSEESSSAASELSTQADDLAAIVADFQLASQTRKSGKAGARTVPIAAQPLVRPARTFGPNGGVGDRHLSPRG